MTARNARKQRPPLDRERRSTSLRCAMSGGSRRPARSCASISPARSASAAGTGQRAPDLEAIAERFRRARLCRRCGLCAVQVAVADRPRLRRAAGRPVAARRPESRTSDAARRARACATQRPLDAALRFAERRRIGPFAAERRGSEGAGEERSAAMVRAGHGFALARAIVDLAPGSRDRPRRADAKPLG